MFGQWVIVFYYFGKVQGYEEQVVYVMNVLVLQFLDIIEKLLEGVDYVVGIFSVGDIVMFSWLCVVQIVGFYLDFDCYSGMVVWLECCFVQSGYVKVIVLEEQFEVVIWVCNRYGIEGGKIVFRLQFVIV